MTNKNACQLDLCGEKTVDVPDKETLTRLIFEYAVREDFFAILELPSQTSNRALDYAQVIEGQVACTTARDRLDLGLPANRVPEVAGHLDELSGQGRDLCLVPVLLDPPGRDGPGAGETEDCEEREIRAGRSLH